MVASLHALSFPLPGGICRHTEEDCHLSEVIMVMFNCDDGNGDVIDGDDGHVSDHGHGDVGDDYW